LELGAFFSCEPKDSKVNGVCSEPTAVAAAVVAWFPVPSKTVSKKDDEEGFAALLTTGFGGSLKAIAGCETFTFGSAKTGSARHWLL
jgi:hypothetical protein